MKRIKIKTRRFKREELVIGESEKKTKANVRKLEDLLWDLGVEREVFVRRAWKRYYNYHLTYYKVFKNWRKGKKFKRLIVWFKRQPLYPSEVNRIVNMMFVLDQRFGLDIVKDNILWKAIFLSFMLEDDLRDRTNEMYRRRGFKKPETSNQRHAHKEMLARGFIHINDFEDYKPGYNYVVSNIGSREYYYPQRCFSNAEQCYKEGLLDVHVLQSLVGVPGFTAINYAVDKRYKPKKR